MRSINRLAAVAALALTGPVLTAGPAAASAPWAPPAGYVYENSYFGTSAWCNQIGQEGVGAGKWAAYVCHETLRGIEHLMIYSDLYVKR
ncbi:hypothetical protein [Nonomuraea gerenzanensis]|uniref:hypothetical protein n=1 Tax=Nonomuraea gerenzanensis TaxID=93944 RepID=UPI0015668635|nr:hypothetical protein [Nonomuraea gerenzanensis]UBU19212.1 hypothetical protein LCN96_56175 [Nonomuraea gerenzanensis]